MPDFGDRPVLILGAGVNGAAVARELVLNGVPVCLVDRSDIAWGASSRSSRLIHGGLRYLEYGEFRLVRESLEERSRLRKLAPHWVRPFRLNIPVTQRTGGLWKSALGFVSGGRWGKSSHTPRGLWLVRLGLWFYDRFVRDHEFPNSRVKRVSPDDQPMVDAERFRWVCQYTDGQMIYPERFTLGMLTDAREWAAEHAGQFQVWTHRDVKRVGEDWQIIDQPTGTLSSTVRPSLIINATGAWGDLTLDGLSIETPELFGGTKGSHFSTFNSALRAAVGEEGIYAEADDGRLVFVLPMGESIMVGTTDERFEGDPDEAIASEEELDYLIALVNELFPQVNLTRDDIAFHSAGVRPLPKANTDSTGAISRDHSVHISETNGIPVLTLVGGKLTTARAFGETVADDVLSRLGITREISTKDRFLPGGEDHPNSSELASFLEKLAREHDRPVAQISAMWSLVGTRTVRLLKDCAESDSREITGTHLPRDFVRWIISTEWVRTLGDLVERRLMLLYRAPISRATLDELAELLVECEVLAMDQIPAAIAECEHRLQKFYGKSLAQDHSVHTPDG